jgi:hypothetical protein
VVRVNDEAGNVIETHEHAEFDSRSRDMAQSCAHKPKAFGKTIEDATVRLIAHLQSIEKLTEYEPTKICDPAARRVEPIDNGEHED